MVALLAATRLLGPQPIEHFAHGFFGGGSHGAVSSLRDQHEGRADAGGAERTGARSRQVSTVALARSTTSMSRRLSRDDQPRAASRPAVTMSRTVPATPSASVGHCGT